VSDRQLHHSISILSYASFHRLCHLSQRHQFFAQSAHIGDAAYQAEMQRQINASPKTASSTSKPMPFRNLPLPRLRSARDRSGRQVTEGMFRRQQEQSLEQVHA